MADNINPYDDVPIETGQEGTSFQETSPFIDPVISAQFQSDLRTGNTGGVANAFFQSAAAGREPEIARRAETLRTGVEAVGEAAIIKGSEQARRTFQKQGKARSSAVVYGEGGLLDVSEATKLQSEGIYAQGLGEIYRDVGAEAAQKSAIGADIYGTGITTQTQRDIANINTASSERIAQINANTTLSGFQKQIEIANINSTTSKAVAEINKSAAIETTTISTTSAETMQAAGFDFFTNDGIKNWVSSDAFNLLTLDEKVRQFNASITESARTFDVTNATQVEQFDKNLELMYDQLEITENRDEWERSIAQQTINVGIKQFDKSLMRSTEQFNAQLQWAKDKHGIEETRIKELQRSYLLEQAREFNITSTNDLYQYQTTFIETAEQFDLTFAQSSEIQNAALKIQQEKHATDEIGKAIGIQLQVLENPAIVAYLDGLSKKGKAGLEAAGAFTDAVMTEVFNSQLSLSSGDLTQVDLNNLVNDMIATTNSGDTILPPKNTKITDQQYRSLSSEDQATFRAYYGDGDEWRKFASRRAT